MHEESTNGGWSQWLAGGGLPHDGEEMGQRRRKLRPLTSFIRGRREVSTQRSHASAMTHQRQTGLAGMRHGEAVPASVGFVRCTVGLNRHGPLFIWARPNPSLESFSIYSN
jgi:hypothetical protein